MLKNNILILFTLLFMATITLPSILVILDNSVDVSLLYDISEEEEKGSEKNKEIEVFLEEVNSDAFVFVSNETESNLGFRFKTYPKPHLNLISPPPDFI